MPDTDNAKPKPKKRVKKAEDQEDTETTTAPEDQRDTEDVESEDDAEAEDTTGDKPDQSGTQKEQRDDFENQSWWIARDGKLNLNGSNTSLKQGKLITSRNLFMQLRRFAPSFLTNIDPSVG